MSEIPVIKQEVLEQGFLEEVKKNPGAEKIQKCIQCGTCSGSCPASKFMDITPRKMVLMSLTGMKAELLKSKSIWLCASCYSCSLRCPRGIPVTEFIYALKNMAMNQKYTDGRKLSGPVFYKVFNNQIKQKGRINEGMVMTFFALKTNPLKMVDMAPLGIKLFLRRRMPLTMPAIKNKGEFQRILSRLREGKR
jgi:heterodisulfide reductase subunit C